MEVIEFDHVVKKYRSWHERHDSLKSRILNRSEGRWTERTVLNDVSFSVTDGSSFAIIGRNGAGKSTALKLISRILVPNSGRVSVTGRVSALLELGAGFHPDLTGRENIFLNGAVLGLSQRTLQERFDDIVEFSGLEDYIENQVKTYSSGMYARLGFAVAVNVDPDILLLDEVLAVGDSAFRQKCRAKIEEMRLGGRTVVIVSHDTSTVTNICDRAVWIEKGKVKAEGSAADVVTKYRAAADPTIRLDDDGFVHFGKGEQLIQFKQLLLDGSDEAMRIPIGGTLRVALQVAPSSAKTIGIDLVDPNGYVVGRDESSARSGSVEFVVENLTVVRGRYTLRAWVADADGETIDGIELRSFNVVAAQGMKRPTLDLNGEWK